MPTQFWSDVVHAKIEMHNKQVLCTRHDVNNFIIFSHFYSFS